MGARRAVPYVHKHPKTGHLNYRRRTPAALRPYIPGNLTEFVRTLAAHSITSAGALERFKAADHEYEVMLAKARKASVTGTGSRYDALIPTLITFLADYYLASELSRDEQARWGRPLLRVPYVPRDDLEHDWDASREMLSGYEGAALKAHWGEWSLSFAAANRHPLQMPRVIHL